MRFALITIATGLSLLAGAIRTEAASISLYDGSLGGTPTSQGWLSFTSTGGTQTTIGSQTNLNTLANSSFFAGYSNYNGSLSNTPSVITPTSLVNASFPTLNRTSGYTVSFTVQLLSQFNDSPNRAGFSVIALSSDKKGIEIGLRNSDIFSQNVGFTVGEVNNSAQITNLLASLTTYNLEILGDTYTLKAGTNILLNGLLRDYSNAIGFGTDVYRTNNFLFFGDDTHSAQANVNIKSLSVNTDQDVPPQTPVPNSESVPEPSTIAGFLLAGGGFIWKHRCVKRVKGLAQSEGNERCS